MTKTLHYCTDAAYYGYTLVSARSFQRYNPEWRVMVHDVGMTCEQWLELARYDIGVVLGGKAETEPVRTKQYTVLIPSARERCKMLGQIGADDLFMYCDSDSLWLGSVEPMVDRFMASGRSFAAAREDDARLGWPIYNVGRISWAWPDEATALRWFPRVNQWMGDSIINSGCIMARGGFAPMGREIAVAYERLRPWATLSEQSIIDSFILDRRWPFHQLNPSECYLMNEKHVKHEGEPYRGRATIDGKPIMFRHFCGPVGRRTLDKHLGYLKARYL